MLALLFSTLVLGATLTSCSEENGPEQTTTSSHIFNLSMYNICANELNTQLTTLDANHRLGYVTGYENVVDAVPGWSMGFIRKPPSLPTSVEVGMTVLLLSGIDDHKQTMTLTAVLHIHWEDDRTVLEDNEFCKNMPATYVVHPTKNLPWYPQWLVVNGRDENVIQSDSWDFGPVQVKNDGAVDWYMSLEFVVSCQLDVQYFPFDVQLCSIDIASPQYDTLIMNYTAENPPIALHELESKSSPLWQIVGVGSGITSLNYPSISFKFLLKRRANFFLMALIVPTAALNAMTAALFITPANQEEKASSAVACVVAYFFIEILFFDQSPVTSDATPILSIFFLFHSYFALFVCFIAARLVYYSEYVEEQEVTDIMLQYDIEIDTTYRTKEDGVRKFRSPEFFNDLCLLVYVGAALFSYAFVFAYLPFKANADKNRWLDMSYTVPTLAPED